MIYKDVHRKVKASIKSALIYKDVFLKVKGYIKTAINSYSASHDN